MIGLGAGELVDFNPIAPYRLGTMRAWRQAMIRHVGEDWAYWADF